MAKMAELKGADAVIRTFRRLGAAALKELEDAAMAEAEEHLKPQISNRAPRRTGELAESIQVEKRRDEIVVGPSEDVDHARHVEFGTRHMAAQPYMRPVFDTRWQPAHRNIARRLGTKLPAVVRRAR